MGLTDTCSDEWHEWWASLGFELWTPHLLQGKISTNWANPASCKAEQSCEGWEDWGNELKNMVGRALSEGSQYSELFYGLYCWLLLFEFQTVFWLHLTYKKYVVPKCHWPPMRLHVAGRAWKHALYFWPCIIKALFVAYSRYHGIPIDHRWQTQYTLYIMLKHAL